MPFAAKTSFDVPVFRTCVHCDAGLPALVRAFGVATGPSATEGVSQRAYDGAIESAYVLTEFVPCPRCHRRNVWPLLAAWGRGARLTLSVVVGAAILLWMFDGSSLKRTLDDYAWLFGGALVVVQMLGAVPFVSEALRAHRDVRFEVVTPIDLE